jgi:hypothetical protein
MILIILEVELELDPIYYLIKRIIMLERLLIQQQFKRQAHIIQMMSMTGHSKV